MSILITGASGFLGENFLKELRKEKANKTIYLLLRGKSLELFSEKYAQDNQIFCIEGDLTNPDIFEDQDEFKLMAREITEIIHLAALYDLEAPREKLIKINVIGTQNLLFFGRYCQNLKGFHYASSIAIAGDYDGPFNEGDFDQGQSFSDAYGYSKYKAEEVVRLWSSKNPQIKVNIFRFGIIIGDSKSGEFAKRDGIYYFLKAIVDINRFAGATFKSPYLVFPFDGEKALPIVTVDFCSAILCEGLKKSDKGMHVYHVLNEDLPTLKEFLEDFVLALGHQTKFLGLPRIKSLEKLLSKLLSLLGLPGELVDYMYLKPEFTQNNVKRDFKAKNPSYRDFNAIIFKRAVSQFKNSPVIVYPQVINFLSRCESIVLMIKNKRKL